MASPACKYSPYTGERKPDLIEPLLSRRRTYKPHDITWDSIAAEATGKQFVMPILDREGRQIVIMRPR